LAPSPFRSLNASGGQGLFLLIPSKSVQKKQTFSLFLTFLPHLMPGSKMVGGAAHFCKNRPSTPQKLLIKGLVFMSSVFVYFRVFHGRI
jgi:hypothetical protein